MPKETIVRVEIAIKKPKMPYYGYLFNPIREYEESRENLERVVGEFHDRINKRKLL